jgi:zinc transport system ATP-binding protein
MTIIKTENLSLSYDSKEVIQNLNIEIKKGDYMCIIGENGSGKSTFIKALLKLIKPTSGKIVLTNDLVDGNIGYLPQQSDDKKDFPASVNEIIMSGFQNKYKFLPIYTKEHKQKAQQAYKLLGIENLKKKSFCELSGGQKQRVLLARSFCASENILILDEPVSGLDPVITKGFYEIIKDLNQNNQTTIIMVTHDLDVISQYANKVLHLYENTYEFSDANQYKTNRGLN